MWFMGSGSDNTIPVSTCNQQQRQQQQQLMGGLNRDNTDYNKNMTVFHQQYEDNQQCNNLDLYNYQLNGQQYCSSGSFLDPKIASLQGGLNDDIDPTIQTTRHFIDAWSTAKRVGLYEIRNKASASSARKLPSSSLTLSMLGGNVVDEDNEHGVEMGIGLTNDEALKSQWMSHVSCMNSAPGGPLGEALCLGNAGLTRGGSIYPFPHGYSHSSATSSCSKGSCEDGSHQFNFVGNGLN